MSIGDALARARAPFGTGWTQNIGGRPGGGGAPPDPCPPTVRMRGLIPSTGSTLNIGSPNLPRDVPADEAAKSLDEFLGEQRWVETSRVTSQTQAGGVTVQRIDEVTFARPSGERTTLVLNHPPLDTGGPIG